MTVLLFILAIPVFFLLAGTLIWYSVFGKEGAKWNWRVALLVPDPYMRWNERQGWSYLTNAYEEDRKGLTMNEYHAEQLRRLGL